MMSEWLTSYHGLRQREIHPYLIIQTCPGSYMIPYSKKKSLQKRVLAIGGVKKLHLLRCNQLLHQVNALGFSGFHHPSHLGMSAGSSDNTFKTTRKCRTP